MRCIRILCLVMLFTFFAQPGHAADRLQSLSFADILFAEGDHYRAITEYKRFLHLFPADSEAPRATLRIAECYLAGRRWAEAETALERVEREHPGTTEAGQAALLLAEVPYRQGHFAAARRRFLQLAEQAPDPANRREARYRLAWSLIEEGRYAAAAQELAPLTEAKAAELAAELPPLERLPRKSPHLAGALSALLPGAGQLYAGRPRDAALALLLNTAFIAGAWESFDNGNEVVGGILLLFEAGWYTGNIFNAATSAQKFNREVQELEKGRLRERFGLTLSLRQGTPVVGMNLRY